MLHAPIPFCSRHDACRVPAGSVDTILSYCHNNLANELLLDLLPYLKDKGVGVISASFSSMGLLRKEVSTTCLAVVLNHVRMHEPLLLIQLSIKHILYHNQF